MNSPNPTSLSQPELSGRKVLASLLISIFAVACLLCACGGKVLKETQAEPNRPKVKEARAVSVPMWQGNPARTFYGTGPWSEKALEVVWDFKTGWCRGRFHKDPWGGSGWRGQPAIVGDRICFGSAGGYVYCVNKKDGSLIWSYQTTDGAKSSPVVVGDRLVIGNLDNTVYCLNANDGTLVWKYKTGFE